MNRLSSTNSALALLISLCWKCIITVGNVQGVVERDAHVPGATAGSRAFWGSNPIIDDQELLADPCILEHDGTLYIYPTTIETGFQVYWRNLDDVSGNWSGPSLVFDRPGTCSRNFLNMGGRANSALAWAPHVLHDSESGNFYMYYSECMAIGVAVAQNPMGPFTDHGHILDWAIDAFVLNDNGNLYLYYAKLSHLPFPAIPTGERVWVQKLSSFTEVNHSHKSQQVLTTVQAWETGNIVSIGPIGWPMTINEGPWVTRVGNVYYLTYSGNTATTVNYDLGYATSDSPLGPFVKGSYPGQNPFVTKEGTILGPGHHSIWQNKSDGKYWAVYHQKTAPDSSWKRYLAVDEIHFENGKVAMTATRLSDDQSSKATDRLRNAVFVA